LTDYNGMSGSPVWKIEMKEREVVAELAGVLLRAGDGKGTFVDAAVLVRMLDKALALQPPPPDTGDAKDRAGR